MSYRRLFVLALVAGLPGIAGAQFTTFIPPRAKVVVDSAKTVVAAATVARTDSAVNMRLTNMKTWVDSAAGVAAVPAPMTAADSLATATTVASADTSVPATTMRNGTRAPATASALPLIALLGAATLSVGLLLLAGPKPARKRA
jgi:hypothetical protein